MSGLFPVKSIYITARIGNHLKLPDPPSGRHGWPWDVPPETVPPLMPDGTPWPLVTIVTPSYNQAGFLEETIRSVLLQGYPNLEYIIMDGCSIDGSVEIIQKYSPFLAYWISLSAIGQHSLLPRRFPSGILIPKAVWQEVVESGQGRSGAGEIASAEWISVCEVTDRSFVSLLRGELDEGEAEAIALARQERLSVVLLDEKHARRVAPTVGTSSSWNSGRAPVGKMGWAYRQPARTVRCFTNSGWLPLEPCSGSGSFEYSRRKRVKVVFRFQIARPIGRRSPTPARRFDSLLYGLCLRWRKRRPVRGDRPPPAAQCVWGEQAGRGTGHSICRR